MAESVKCACCGNKAYRDKRGRMMLHTRIQVGDAYGEPIRAVVCEGSERGARG